MSTEDLSKEQRILRAMRKTLASVVKDCTPNETRESPLTESTIQAIKDCFALIAARERELGDQLGFAPSRPYYPDETPPSAKVVSFTKPKPDDPDRTH